VIKPKQLFIIIYVNVCVKRVDPHKTNNNIMFRNGKIPESQFSVPFSTGSVLSRYHTVPEVNEVNET
jgi:hypothetical protein